EDKRSFKISLRVSIFSFKSSISSFNSDTSDLFFAASLLFCSNAASNRSISLLISFISNKISAILDSASESLSLTSSCCSFTSSNEGCAYTDGLFISYVLPNGTSSAVLSVRTVFLIFYSALLFKNSLYVSVFLCMSVSLSFYLIKIYYSRRLPLFLFPQIVYRAKVTNMFYYYYNCVSFEIF